MVAKKAASKKAKAKPAKAKKSRVVPLRQSAERVARAGDNSEINQPLVDIFDEDDHLEEQQKMIGKQRRELRAKAKEEHGISSDVYQHQKKLRRMEAARRVQFEHGCVELNEQLGYQFTLDMVGDGSDDNANAAADEAERAAAEA